MHYAFFAPDPEVVWKGRIELRGLKPGRYRVHESVEGTDLGEIDAASPSLVTSFTHHLLLEAVPVP
jgi:alpha-galactosidase